MDIKTLDQVAIKTKLQYLTFIEPTTRVLLGFLSTNLPFLDLYLTPEIFDFIVE